ncbi:hypothetical protein NKJ73_31840 [Mesorhizobium sp. M0074]|uniref:hypothetical protein n=1 Tax=Mesorhizobium sp. M0074 TaxID=2956869 RepID=UPI00333E0BD3
MREKGFCGQIGVVSEWARRRRLAGKADQSALARTPSARSIARLMTLARDDLCGFQRFTGRHSDQKPDAIPRINRTRFRLNTGQF